MKYRLKGGVVKCKIESIPESADEQAIYMVKANGRLTHCSPDTFHPLYEDTGKNVGEYRAYKLKNDVVDVDFKDEDVMQGTTVLATWRMAYVHIDGGRYICMPIWIFDESFEPVPDQESKDDQA